MFKYLKLFQCRCQQSRTCYLKPNLLSKHRISSVKNQSSRSSASTSKLVSSTAQNENEAKPKRLLSDFNRLLSLAKTEKWSITGGIGCLVLSSSITMAVPYGLGKILDIIYASDNAAMENNMAILDQFCLALCGIFIIGGLANFGRVYLFNNASLRITKRLREKLYKRILRQESNWFDSKGSGELINRLSSDTSIVGNSLSKNLSDGMRSIAMVIGGTGMMIYTSPSLAAVGLSIVPCVACTAIFYGKYLRNISRELVDKFAIVMKVGEERIGNIKTVKMFSKEKQENLVFSKELEDALSIGYRETRARALFYGMTGLSGNIIILSVLYYGGTLVASEQMTIGGLTSFLLYAGYTAISIGGLSNFYSELNKGIGSAARVWEIFDRKPSIPIEGGIRPVQKPYRDITFENISFNYDSRPGAPVLKDLNLTLKSGTITAVVGRSGSGKSSIASLLLRLYDPQNGSVTLDGLDLKDIDPTWLRSHIGAVNQEPILFSGTIRENIMYGLEDGQTISETEFQKVVREASVDEFVKNLPDGLETLVGQRGALLSGGQKQRVAIARALIKNPTILILDEATSSLDSVSEELIQKALASLTIGRTVLTIAHRLSTVRNATNIAVLQDGRIIENGSYGVLIAQENGKFKELVETQTFGSDKL